MNIKYPCVTFIPHDINMHEHGIFMKFDMDLTIKYIYDYDFKASMVMT